jgi:tripartite-type tricarboxylate transporter receptor subunit TctC
MVCANDRQPYRILHQFTPSNFYGIAFHRFTESINQAAKRPVVFEPQVGGNGLVVMTRYQNVTDDKTFVVLNANVYTIMPLLQSVSYKVDDLEPLAMIGKSTMCYAVKAANAETDFFKFLSNNPTGFYGTLSAVSAEAVLLSWINQTQSLKQTGVSYKSYPDLTQALLRGDIQWSIIPKRSCGPELGLVELKNVPKKYDIDHWFGENWFGLFGKKTQDKKIRDEFTAMFMDAWWKHKEVLGQTVQYPDQDLRHEDFRKAIQNHSKKWAALRNQIND